MTSSVDDDSRFATVTPEDHSAWIWVAVLLSLSYSIVFLGCRVVDRLHRYGLDDLLLALAYLFAIGHWAAIFVSLSHQLGKSSNITTEEQLRDASKALLAGRVLLIPTLAFAKISIIALIRQVFTAFREGVREAWVACDTLIAVLAGWALMSIIALSAGCSAAATIGLSEGVCRNESLRWYLVLIPDALTEFGSFVLICWLIRGMSMNWRRKMAIAVVFAARIPIAAISLIFLHFTVKFLHTDRADWPLAITVPVIWQEILVGCSLISAIIPFMSPFMMRFYTGGLVLSELTGEDNDQMDTGSTRASSSPRRRRR